MESLASILATFLATRRPCFRLHIYYVLDTFWGFSDCPFCKKAQVHLYACSGSPKQPSILNFFQSFMPKHMQMGAQWEWAKVSKTASFLLAGPVGAPWDHPATKMVPKGCQNDFRGPRTWGFGCAHVIASPLPKRTSPLCPEPKSTYTWV